MPWTSVPKPNTSNYVNVNTQGREQYDQVSIYYDDASIFYDGVNSNQWTDVAKPSYLLTWNDLPIAFNDYNSPWGSPSWTNVNKPQ